jgi:hypothetical protein
LEQIHHVVFVVDAWRVQAGIDFSPLCLSSSPLNKASKHTFCDSQ